MTTITALSPFATPAGVADRAKAVTRTRLEWERSSIALACGRGTLAEFAALGDAELEAWQTYRIALALHRSAETDAAQARAEAVALARRAIASCVTEGLTDEALLALGAEHPSALVREACAPFV